MNENETKAVPEELRQYFLFSRFNQVQSKCFNSVWNSGENLLVSAPTSSGKTTIFELAILREMSLCGAEGFSQLKAIYICPLKSLCQEKLAEWRAKFQGKLLVNELTGDTFALNSVQDYTTLKESNIILTTPEKWDSITRKFNEQKERLGLVRLLMVDEIHLLNSESRGSALEAVIARMIFQFEHNKQKNPLRIVAVSATIANPDELASWLRVPPSNKLIFSEEYRSVPLEKKVYGYDSRSNPYQFEKYLSMKLTDVIRLHSEGKPTLVFCTTQKGTVDACESLLGSWDSSQFIKGNDHARLLLQRSSEVDNSDLKRFLPCGIGYHNASLSAQSRRIVESLFRDGLLGVLCTTTTLAQGVNLPARLVIIKSTSCYAQGGIREYTLSEIQQMIGRAGRPQFDYKGVAVLMTDRSNLSKYLALMSTDGKLEPLESNLLSQLPEHLNAEIVLGTFSDKNSAVEYFEKTLMFLRLQNREALTQRIQECLEKLEKSKMIWVNQSTGKFQSLPVGVESSKFYLSVETLFQFAKGVLESPNGPTVNSKKGLLDFLTKAQEFEKMKPKQSEKTHLKNLNENLPHDLKLKGPINSFEKKAYVLIVAAMHKIESENWELKRQSQEYLSMAWRISVCFRKFLSEQKIPKGFYEAVILTKELSNKCSRSSPKLILQQVSGIGDKIAGSLVKNGIWTIEKLKCEIQKRSNVIEASGLTEGRVQTVKSWMNELGVYSLELQEGPPGVLKIQVNCQKETKHYFSMAVWSESAPSSKAMLLRTGIRLCKRDPVTFQVDFSQKDVPIRVWFLNEQILGEDLMVFYSEKGKETSEETEPGTNEAKEAGKRVEVFSTERKQRGSGTLDNFLFDKRKNPKKKGKKSQKDTIWQDPFEEENRANMNQISSQLVPDESQRENEANSNQTEEFGCQKPPENDWLKFKEAYFKENSNKTKENTPSNGNCRNQNGVNLRKTEKLPRFFVETSRVNDSQVTPVERKKQNLLKTRGLQQNEESTLNSDFQSQSQFGEAFKKGLLNGIQSRQDTGHLMIEEGTAPKKGIKQTSKRQFSTIAQNQMNEDCFGGVSGRKKENQEVLRVDTIPKKKTIVDLAGMTLNNIFSSLAPSNQIIKRNPSSSLF